MARTYAGILGYLGMTVMLLRGAINGAGFEGSVLQAIGAMAAMTVVGAVVGSVAKATVDESVRNTLEKRITEMNPTTAADA